jgi:S1-C subfamily serine protease
LGVELFDQPTVPGRSGAFVRAVIAGSPAEKAGVKPGDIITSFNGNAVASPVELRRQIARIPVGSSVGLKVLRGNQEQTIAVTILEQPASLAVSSAPAQPAPAGTLPPDNPLAGITVMEIPADQRNNLPSNVSGVVVSKIDPDSPAASSLQPGDAIEEIDRQPIGNPEEFRRIASSLKPGRSVMLSISRGRRRSFIVVPTR